MDTQLKRGFVEACVLRVLEGSDNYGYQIVQDLYGIIDVNESTLYPILRRLEERKCLAIYTVEHHGRLRRYYKITDKGRAEIADFLKDWGEVMVAYEYISGGKKQ